MADGTSVLELTTLPTMAMSAGGTGGVSSPDERLARACARGDAEAFETLYRDYGSRLKSIAFNHLGNLAEAEDAVQETFLRVHRSAASFTAQAAFSTWVCRILLNVCHDVIRRRSRRIEEAPMDVVEGRREDRAPGADDALRLTLRRLLGRLPAQRRTVFLLFEVEGMSHREIAEVLDIQESYSKWLLFATKRDLQRMLREESEVQR